MISYHKIKIEIEQLIKKFFNEKTIYNIKKNKLNGITKTFFNKSKQIFQTRKNQEFNKTLFNLKNKTNIKLLNTTKETEYA